MMKTGWKATPSSAWAQRSSGRVGPWRARWGSRSRCPGSPVMVVRFLIESGRLRVEGDGRWCGATVFPGADRPARRARVLRHGRGPVHPLAEREELVDQEFREAPGGLLAEQGQPVAHRQVEAAPEHARADREAGRHADRGRTPDRGYLPGVRSEV